MIKLVLFSLFVFSSSFAAQYRDYSSHEYEFLPLNQGEQILKKVKIKTQSNKILIFIFEKVECDAYVDNCFTDFSNEDNPHFELYGLEVCFSESCKYPHPNFPNVEFILREKFPPY